MYKWFVLAIGVAASVAVFAQGKEIQQHADSTREQRRVELRMVLQAQRLPDRVSVDDKTSTGRQLTSQEHAELRQQLREQRAGKPANP